MVPLANQVGDHRRAGELVRIRIVDDDLAIAAQRRRDSRGTVSQRAGKTDRTMLVGILEARVDDDRRRAGLELLFQIFAGNSRNGHEEILWPLPRASVNLRPE